MIWFLIFYWFFAGLFIFGSVKYDEKLMAGRSQVACFIVTITLGGIFFPIFLGALFNKICDKLNMQ